VSSLILFHDLVLISPPTWGVFTTFMASEVMEPCLSPKKICC